MSLVPGLVVVDALLRGSTLLTPLVITDILHRVHGLLAELAMVGSSAAILACLDLDQSVRVLALAVVVVAGMKAKLEAKRSNENHTSSRPCPRRSRR